MFEDSLALSNSLPNPRQRWLVTASFTLQAAIVATLLVLPLLTPLRLPLRAFALPISLPLPPQPRPPVEIPHIRPVLANTATAVISAPATLNRPSIDLPATAANPAPPDSGYLQAFGSTHDALGSAITSFAAPSSPHIRIGVAGNGGKASTSPRAISSGVSAGLLLAPIQPLYPAIARAAHQSGTVVVEATISTTGNVETAHATSGPMLLQAAAVAAVRDAHYRPFLLNGQPTAVAATFQIHFTLGGQ